MKDYSQPKALNSLLERFKTIKNTPPDTLFDVEPDWKKLGEQRCPICGTKLTLPLRGKVAICRGKRHGDKRPFLISISKFSQIMARNKAQN